MRRILSICNFSFSPPALLLSAFVIICMEIALSHFLPAKFFSHEIDRVLYEIDTKPMHADYLLIGDSVGRQILRDYEESNSFLMLATNQAIEMTGQYFLIQRLLNRNPVPRLVIFVGLPHFLNANLEQPFTENYVVRTFTQCEEILELFLVKRDLTMTLKSICYKFLASLKYRLHLQKLFLGDANANIYLGVGENLGMAGGHEHSVQKIMKQVKGHGVSLYHFRKLIELLTKKGVCFCYLPVPIKEVRDSTIAAQNASMPVFKVLAKLQNEGFQVSYIDRIIEYPESMFSDHAHYNEKGIIEAKLYLEHLIQFVISNNGKT